MLVDCSDWCSRLLSVVFNDGGLLLSCFDV